MSEELGNGPTLGQPAADVVLDTVSKGSDPGIVPLVVTPAVTSPDIVALQDAVAALEARVDALENP